MSKEIRAIFLATLTISLYAISIFIKDGSLIFPYPLNSFIFLILAVQFAYWNREKKTPLVLVLLTSVFAVLSNQIIWEVILPLDSLEQFFAQPWMHWFHLLFVLSALMWGLFTIINQSQRLSMILGGSGLILLGFGFFSSFEILVLVGYLALTCSVTLKSGYKSFDKLWILLFILELSKWLTFFFA